MLKLTIFQQNHKRFYTISTWIWLVDRWISTHLVVYVERNTHSTLMGKGRTINAVQLDAYIYSCW